MHLFSDVYYYLPLCLTAQRREELTTVLDANGGTAVDLDQATHVITNSAHFEGWQSVADEVAVVTDYWVDRSLILGKKQPTQYYSPDPAMIFSGVVACSADLGDADCEVLAAGITALGGQWRAGLTRDVTHLFALTPDSARYETAMHHQALTRMKVLLPHWFDDAVKLGYGALPTGEYEWPNPALLRREGEVRKGKVSGEKKALYKSALGGEERMGEERDVWCGRRVLLGASLELRDGRREAVEAGIRRAGGVVVELEMNDGNGDEREEAVKIEEADVFITKYRAGAAYFKALKWGKTIGTLSWLFHVESTGALSAPSDQLLHFPIPKTPIPGFDHHVITITNYTGEARDYIRKLITTMGATFTPSMSSGNTVVIAAYIGGTKTSKAHSWNIPIVNHTWLEDCFVQWRDLTVGLEKYISFPPGVDFSTVLGEKGIGRAVLDKELERALAWEEGAEEEAEERKKGEGEVQPPTSTAASAKEMAEVENAISVDEPAGDMDVDEEYDPDIPAADEEVSANASLKKPKPPKKPTSGRKPLGVSFAGDHDDVGMQDSPSRSRRSKGNEEGGVEVSPRRSSRLSGIIANPAKKPTSTSKPQQPQRDSESEVEIVEEAPKPKRGLVRRATKPVVEILTPSKAKVKGKGTHPPPTGSDEDTDPLGPSTSRTRAGDASAKAKIARPMDTDSDDDLPPPSALVARNAPNSGRSNGGRTSPLTPAPSSPAKAKGTPRKTVSVEIPVPAAQASPKRGRGRPRKSDSVRKEAKEGSSSRHSSPSPAPPRRVVTGPRAEGVGVPEFETPSANITRTGSKRSAATRATQQLREVVMPDVVNFEKEMKRGNVKPAWEEKGKEKGEKEKGETSVRKRPSIATAGDDEDVRRKKPRMSDENETPGVDLAEPDEEEDEVPNATARKTSGKGKKRASNAASETGSTARGAIHDHTRKKIRLITSGITLSDDILKALKKLGVEKTDKPVSCTHLIMQSVTRTEKLLCAIPRAPFVLTPDWATDSVEAGRLLPEDNYALVDEENEKRFDFKLSEALDRAKRNHGRLFSFMTFYVTKSIPRGFEVCKDIIEANSGKAEFKTPSARAMNAQQYRYIISCEEDKSIWAPLAREGIPIYTRDWLLHCALTQTFETEDTPHKMKLPSKDA